MNVTSNQSIKNKTISGVFWKGLERVLAQLVSAAVAIVIARILMPEDYSVVSVVTIFFSFCNIFISGGLNTALIQKKDADTLDYSTILIANMVMASVLYVVMFFCAPFIADLFKKELITPVIRVMSASFFISGYKAVVSAKITSDLAFKKFFWSTIIGTAISAVVGIIMAANGFGAWALVAQQMTNTFVDAFILTFSSKIRIKPKFSGQRFKSLFKYGGKITLSSLINEAYNQTKPLIVGIRFSTTDLAYYNKGKTYPQLLVTTGNDTLSSSLFPVMAKVQDNKEKVLAMTRRFMQLSSFIVFPLMLGFFAVSENFVKVFLTEKWLPIVPFLMIFCVSDMLKPIQTGNLQAIRAIGRSDVFLVLEIIKKISYAVIILLFVLFTDSPVLLAVSGIVTSLLGSFINTLPNKKLIGYGYAKQFSDLFLNFVIAIIMCVAVYFMNYIPINMYLLLFLQVITGIIIYFSINLVVKNRNLMYLIETFRELRKNRKEKHINNDTVTSKTNNESDSDKGQTSDVANNSDDEGGTKVT